MKHRKDVSTRKARSEFIDRITELRERIRALRSEVADLKAERDQLREENQALRRDLTHARLMDDLMSSIGGASEDDEAVLQQARSLYQTLPSTCSFSGFFQVAEEKGIETEAARRCLRHFLSRELLVQEGGQLTKKTQALEVE